MDEATRAELEAQADRATRRGDFAGALKNLQQLCAEFPDDLVLIEKKQRLEENLQPMELLSAKARQEPEAAAAPKSPLQQAELLAHQGDYAGAIALYRKLLAEKPDSPLISERLAELFQLVQVQKPRPSPMLPADPQHRLKELLVRVGARKRPSS